MQIPISDAVFQTQIFIFVFISALLLTLKKRPSLYFDNDLTNELKGFAMLAIIFSHIGYFLVSDHRFLYPLSIAAGVGVNLFLFLSGYGLTTSSVKKPFSILTFYLKRLLKLFVPLWVVLTLFVLLDFFLLQRSYPFDYLARSFSGIYLTLDTSTDIDSPLWYFTLILYFYLIFPLVFIKSKPWLSAIIILAVSWALLQLPLPIHKDNLTIYKLHFLAFPLGVLFASIRQKLPKPTINQYISSIFLVISTFIFGYFAIHSGVGEGKFKEQAISILSVFLILCIFLLKKIQFRLLNFFGRYSYEIYLIHWPILFRFQNLYQLMPASLATTFYLIEFIILGFLLYKVSQKLLKYLRD